MKEAAGEANMTVITIILIAIVLAIGTPIVTSMMQGVGQKSCVDGGGTWDSTNNKCDYGTTGTTGTTDTP